MAETITRLGLWDWFKNEQPPDNQGYMFWNHPNVNKICSCLKNNRHSGSTLAYCMRQCREYLKDFKVGINPS